jgi:hypothetical protein
MDFFQGWTNSSIVKTVAFALGSIPISIERLSRRKVFQPA